MEEENNIGLKAELKIKLRKFAREVGLRHLELQLEYLETHPNAALPDDHLSREVTMKAYKEVIEAWRN